MKYFTIIFVIVLLVFLTGCGNVTNNKVITNVTFTDYNGAQSDVLPVAYEGQFYSQQIIPTSGVGPFVCSLVSGSSLPGDMSFSECSLVGNPPILSSGTTQGNYPFSFMIKDFDGNVVGGPFSFTLVVMPAPPEFLVLGYPETITIGEAYEHNFCVPESNSPLYCGKDPKSDDPTKGVPPYRFSATNLPLGLMIRSDGLVFGTVKKGTLDTSVTSNICVTDSIATVVCQDVVFTLYKPEDEVTAEPCISPYDGTWQVTVKAEGTNYIRESTKSIPYSISYTMDIRIACSLAEESGYDHIVTDVTASDDFFGCTKHCNLNYTKEQDADGFWAHFYIPKSEGTGEMVLTFPNKAKLIANNLVLSGEELHQKNTYTSAGFKLDGDWTYKSGIETYKCPDCTVPMNDNFEITITKYNIIN